MRRLACLLVAWVLTGCTSSSSDIGKEMREHPPSTAGPGKVAIWTSSAAPVLAHWPRVKTWSGTIIRCDQGATGPEVGAMTDDGLPVTIQVLQPSGEEARLAAVVQYAPDGSPPHHDSQDQQLLIVSDQPFSEEGDTYPQGSFDGGFVHAAANESPPGDSSGTFANVNWHCSEG